MEESRTPAKKAKKNRTVTLKVNRDILMIAIAVVLILAAYFVGVQNGKEQAKDNRTSSSSSDRSSSASASKRWTSVGTVQEVSDTSIKVVDSRKETKQAAINKETSIVDRKGTKLSAKDIKKDQRVIVSGTKDDKNNLTATRIRIQQ